MIAKTITKCKAGGGVFLRNTNKKGLTLIELLAVIVVIAIISLIAIPTIGNIIEGSRREAAKDSIYEYVKAIENKVALSTLENVDYEDKDGYAYDEIKPDMKGSIPTGGMYSLKNGIITEGHFCINGYLVDYKDSKATIDSNNSKCTSESLKLDGSLKLSSNSGHYTYPEVGTIEIIENKGNGKLSCESSDTKVATCLVKGNKVTVKSGTKEGSATLTITSEATSKYKEAKAAYLAYTSKGLLSITANGYNGIYDNKAHGITVSTGQNATVKYGEEEETYNLDESPTYTDVGSYTVYYEVSQEGYNTIRGSKTVVITKADGLVELKETNISIAYKDTKEIDVTKNISGGNIKVEVLNKDIVEAEIKDNKIVITGKKLGTGKIKVISEATRNYKESSTEIEVTVVKANNTLKLSSTSGKYTYPESKTIEVEGNISGGLIKCVSADTKIANCTVNGNIITVKSGTKEGSTTLTITSEATENYNEQRLSYVAITAKGTLTSYTVVGYNKVYDGLSHRIVVTSSGSTVKYGTSEGTYNLDESPKYTDVGEYTVYYKIETEGYNDITGNAKVVITKAEGEMTSPTAKPLTYTESEQELINRGSSNTGTIEYKLDNGSYSESIPKATNPGTYKVYYRLVGDKNHKDIAESYITVTINKAVLSYTANGYTGVYDSNSHGIVVTSKGTIKYGETEGTYDKNESPKYTDAGKYIVYFKITKEGYYDITGSKVVEITKANNELSISSNVGTYTYPNSGAFTVTKNTSGGVITCSSNNKNIADCSVSGSTVTVISGTTKGIANITVTSAETTNYKSASVVHLATTEEGLLSVTASGYTGDYDSKEHGIVVTSSGSTIKYGTVNGTYNLDSSPKYKNLGEYTVYYQVTRPGYKTITGSKQVIIKDLSAPSTPTIINPTNENWTNKDFSLTVSSSDNVGIAYYQYSYDNSNWTTEADSAATTYVTTAFSIERNQLVYIRACDSTKNCSSSSSTYIRIDKTAPTVPSLSGTNTSWTNQNVNVRPASTDSGSGVNHYESYYSGSWHNYPTDDYFSGERNETVYFRACDNAGNCSGNASTEIHIDKTVPTCGSWSGESTSWTSGNRTISVGCNDSGGSGCKQSSYSVTYTGTTQTATPSFTISDNAGNTAVCSKNVNVYTDKDAPTCGSWSGESTSWTNQNRTISVGCNDSGSGCSQGSYSKTYSDTTKTARPSFTISDNVGHTTTCSKQVNVYIDKNPPFIQCSASINTNYNNLLNTFNAACYEPNDESGCINSSEIESESRFLPRISGWDSKNNPKFVNTTMTPDSNGAIHWIWPYAGDPVRVTASYYDRAGNTSSCKDGLVTVGIAPSNK